MDDAVKKYLSKIGQKGGRRSRRTLDSDSAKAMVRVREARRAYRRYGAACFWSCDPAYLVTLSDLPWVAEQLMKYGDRQAWELGVKLCR